MRGAEGRGILATRGSVVPVQRLKSLQLLVTNVLNGVADSSPKGISVRDGNEPEEKVLGTRVE